MKCYSCQNYHNGLCRNRAGFRGGGGGGGGGGGNRGGCPGPTAFEGAPMVLIIMIFMFFWFIVTRSKLLIKRVKHGYGAGARDRE